MRKIILGSMLAVSTLLPSLAHAQDATLRDDRRDIRQEQRDMRRDYDRGAGPAQLRADRRDVRDARADYRGDWRDYRRSHPDVYRGPAWVGPRGYNYRPVEAGYRFRPEFYDRRYWVDPYRYHLRPAPGFARWVRYGPDVLLIDVRSGAVMEVNRGFFF